MYQQNQYVMSQSLVHYKKPVFHIGLVFFVLTYGLIIHRCNSEAALFETKAQQNQLSAQTTSMAAVADSLR